MDVHTRGGENWGGAGKFDVLGCWRVGTQGHTKKLIDVNYVLKEPTRELIPFFFTPWGTKHVHPGIHVYITSPPACDL